MLKLVLFSLLFVKNRKTFFYPVNISINQIKKYSNILEKLANLKLYAIIHYIHHYSIYIIYYNDVYSVTIIHENVAEKHIPLKNALINDFKKIQESLTETRKILYFKKLVRLDNFSFFFV